MLVPSGSAAIATVGLALLKAGDEVLIPDNAYGPAKTLPRWNWHVMASPTHFRCLES